MRRNPLCNRNQENVEKSLLIWITTENNVLTMICEKAELIHADFLENEARTNPESEMLKQAMVCLIIFRTVRHGEEASADTDAANDLVTEFVSIEEQTKFPKDLE
ncbi:hypothetical protein CDAR_34121 [Caerostris darwini]|uniref:Uncharacterized protein n=1 Tax=Caerostris darwini TaxID=1538125 RepID=A0AAV4RCX3_9ARAC|nr:hypothetical protein CDAR_34121 [Caerostris darwini]